MEQAGDCILNMAQSGMTLVKANQYPIKGDLCQIDSIGRLYSTYRPARQRDVN